MLFLLYIKIKLENMIKIMPTFLILSKIDLKNPNFSLGNHSQRDEEFNPNKNHGLAEIRTQDLRRVKATS